MKAVEKQDRLVANIHETEFKPFPAGGIATAGETYLSLDANYPPGCGFHVYRMAPGTTTTPHEHTCDEQFLVLEGEATDNDGYTYRQGDLVLLKKGSEHSSYSKDGCLLAVFIATPETAVEE